MALATIESIKAAADKPAVVHSIDEPGMGGAVCLRELSGKDRDEFDRDWELWRRDENHNERDWTGYYAFLLARVICSEDGRPLFPDDRESVFMLQRLPSKVLARVARRAMTINGIGTDAEESVAKNSAAGQS